MTINLKISIKGIKKCSINFLEDFLKNYTRFNTCRWEILELTLTGIYIIFLKNKNVKFKIIFDDYIDNKHYHLLEQLFIICQKFERKILYQN